MSMMDKMMHVARILICAGTGIGLLAILIGTIYPLLTPDEARSDRGKHFWIQLGIETILTMSIAAMVYYLAVILLEGV